MPLNDHRGQAALLNVSAVDPRMLLWNACDHNGGCNQVEGAKSLAKKDVFILGAGFSRAIYEPFPLAKDLLDLVINELSRSNEGVNIPGEGFETWLSRIAEEQPYLSPDQNLARSATFMRASAAIAKVLGVEQRKALSAELPQWLGQLVQAWHVRGATLISFNYDDLVECAVAYSPLTQNAERVTSHDILDRLPPLPPSLMSEETTSSLEYPRDTLEQFPAPKSEPLSETFRLLKLHGSLSWYWVPNDVTGATLQRWPHLGTFLQPRLDDSGSIERALPGRSTFIAPPSSTKSKYLGNPVIRTIWTRAFEALRNAESVVFIGYSVPLQDQAAMSMIREAFNQNVTRPEICIVDRDPASVTRNLSDALPPDFYGPHLCFEKVSDFVDSYIKTTSEEAVLKLRCLVNELDVNDEELAYLGKPLQGDVDINYSPYHVGSAKLVTDQFNEAATDEDGALALRFTNENQLKSCDVPTLLAKLQDDDTIRSLKVSFHEKDLELLADMQ